MMEYIRKMSLGAEGFTKKGFIEKFGDPFAVANNIINTDANVEFTSKKQEELDYYREKYGVNN